MGPVLSKPSLLEKIPAFCILIPYIVDHQENLTQSCFQIATADLLLYQVLVKIGHDEITCQDMPQCIIDNFASPNLQVLGKQECCTRQYNSALSYIFTVGYHLDVVVKLVRLSDL